MNFAVGDNVYRYSVALSPAVLLLCYDDCGSVEKVQDYGVLITSEGQSCVPYDKVMCRKSTKKRPNYKDWEYEGYCKSKEQCFSLGKKAGEILRSRIMDQLDASIAELSAARSSIQAIEI